MTAQTAPAAHLVGVKADPAGGGVLVLHTLCEAPEVFVPNRAGQNYVLAIDIIHAVVGHECVNSREAAPS